MIVGVRDERIFARCFADINLRQSKEGSVAVEEAELVVIWRK